MSATLLLLIRHGAVDSGDVLFGRAPGLHLNRTGREQAALLPGLLRGLPFFPQAGGPRQAGSLPLAAVYASPLERARETAAPLAAAAGLPVLELPEALEMDFGRWSGKTFAELERDPLWPRFNALRSLTPAPGGESMAQVQARFARGLYALRECHLGGAVAVVSHQDVIRAALCLFLGMPLDFFLRLAVDHASVHALRLFAQSAQVLALNHAPGRCASSALASESAPRLEQS